MTPEQRKTLVELANQEGLSWRGSRAHVAGWTQEYATVTTERPGFWATSWDAVERAIEARTFDGEVLWLSSSAWLGTVQS